MVRNWATPGVPHWPRVIIVAVQDSQLSSASQQIAETGGLEGRAVLHTSGLHTAQELASCSEAGAVTASWHPLQSFPADETITVRWDGVPCAVEGDAEAVDLGFRLARTAGMTPWRIQRESKALYHAAASLAGNLPAILVGAAGALMADCGLPGDESSSNPLAPLVTTCMESSLHGSPLSNLTGPIARGDAATIQRHLEALPDDLARCYEALFQYFTRRKACRCRD